MKYSIIYCSLFFFLLSCSSSPSTSEKETAQPEETQVVLTDAQRKQEPVRTTELTETHWERAIQLNGHIDVPPQNLISVTLPYGGYLRETALLPGMFVRKGQQLALIEDQQFIQLQEDYLVAKSNLHFAELEYKRQQSLHASEAGSTKLLQQAESEKRALGIRANALEQKIKLLGLNPASLSSQQIKRKIALYAPVSGFVSKVNGNVGRYFAPSEEVFELIDPDDVHLTLKVFEKDLSYIQVGSAVSCYTNTRPDQTYPADVILIARDVAADGSTEVHCHFKQYPAHLAPGTYMNARIETAAKPVFALPEECVVDFEGKSYVFVESQDKRYDMKEVITGSTENKLTEIRNPAELHGARIVQTGAYMLLMKLKNKEE